MMMNYLTIAYLVEIGPSKTSRGKAVGCDRKFIMYVW